MGLQQLKTTKSNSKEDDVDTPQLLFSPSLNFIDNHPSKMCPERTFKDSKTKKKYRVRIALQVEVHPGSYKVGPPSFRPCVHKEERLKVEEIEWLTKEKGNTDISALLVRLEEELAQN